MFSSLRSRLWLSYAFLVITALSIVALILFISLIRNPFLYRQTAERLRAVQAVVVERSINSSQNQPLLESAQRASKTFNVRIIQFSQDKQVVFDTYLQSDAGIRFPVKKVLAGALPIVRDAKNSAWLYSIEKLSDNTYLMVAAPRPRISILNVFTDEFLPLIIQSGLIALALSLFVAFIFARWIADPLQKIVLAARGMPSADAKPVEPGGPHEIQELTRAFNQMIERVQSAQRSQRDFVANVSHELKTPLTSIQGFSQAILDGTADSPNEIKQSAQVIYDESGRMYRMASDLLDLARLDAGTADITMSPVQIPALFNAIAEKFTPQLQKAGVNIKVEAPDQLPVLSGDGDRLAQVFTNLVDNALRFTPRNGLISMRASVANNIMLLSVSDTGAGIPAEAQAHIFDRFYQADPARKGGEKHGAGLGLAIAHEIVMAHGGRISVRSKLGEGTTFEVSLPLLKRK